MQWWSIGKAVLQQLRHPTISPHKQPELSLICYSVEESVMITRSLAFFHLLLFFTLCSLPCFLFVFALHSDVFLFFVSLICCMKSKRKKRNDHSVYMYFRFVHEYILLASTSVSIVPHIHWCWLGSTVPIINCFPHLQRFHRSKLLLRCWMCVFPTPFSMIAPFFYLSPSLPFSISPHLCFIL